MSIKHRHGTRLTVYRIVITLVMIGILLPFGVGMNTPTAYACYGPWQVGQQVGLKLGAEIRAGSNFNYPPYPQR